uniref:BPTI/Kunitz inhibitor domain-containing protein n=1 Tax=Ditylenchus dipsaci TaxID=166011 RepID=A0A915CVL8_9BILA
MTVTSCVLAVCSLGEPFKNVNGQEDAVCWFKKPHASIKSSGPSSPFQCPPTHQCKSAQISLSETGVDGQPSVQKGVCCPLPQFVCNLPLEKGSSCKSNSRTTRWWFNSKRGKCEKFLFADCGDKNANNFVSQKQCQEQCRNSKICPSPLVAIPHNTVSPYRLCQPSSTNCSTKGQANGQCVYSNNLGKHVCCAVDISSTILRRRGNTIKKQAVVKEKWIKIANNDVLSPILQRGCLSVGCHPNYPRAFLQMDKFVWLFAILVLCFVCDSQCFQISYSNSEYDVYVHMNGDLKGEVPVPVKLQKDLQDLNIPKTLSFRLNNGRSEFNIERSEFNNRRSKFVTSKISNGSSELNNGGSQLNNGSSEIQNGSTELKNGSSEIINGSSEVQNGSSLLNNGSSEINSTTSTLAPISGNYSVAYQALEIKTGDLVLQLDFWPDFDDFSHDFKPYLRSYALQATFAHVQFAENQTKIWSSGTAQSRSSFHISHCCPKSFEERSAYLYFNHDLYPHLRFTRFCASVETRKYDSTYEIQYSTRRYYPRSVLMYISLYLLQIMLIVSASLTFFLLISKWRRQRKERLRVLPKVSYIYGKKPSLQIIPITTNGQDKDVSQNVYY